MPRRLSLLVLAAGLAATISTVLPVRGDDSAPQRVTVDVPAQAFQTVEIDPVTKGGEKVRGVLQLTAVQLRTDTGTRVIDLQHVRRVTFPLDRQAAFQDTVELASKEIVRGQVTANEFPVKTDDGQIRVFKAADVRELRVVHEMPHSLTAILIGLLTLSAMEIVLGIDNVIFLAIVAGRLPEAQRPKARRIGLAAALGTRILLLLTLSFILGLTAPIFTLPDLPLLHDLEAREVSWRDVILLAGGLFLIGKSVFEMHEKMEAAKAEEKGGGDAAPRYTSFARAIVTIAVIDIVFSLDSVITAVGMVEQVWVMIVAMVLAMLVMLWFSGPIGRFVDRHPTIKVLALAFLILIGVMLVAEGLGQHIDKGYIYFAMGFAVVIEMVNLQLRGSSKKATAATAEVPRAG